MKQFAASGAITSAFEVVFSDVVKADAPIFEEVSSSVYTAFSYGNCTSAGKNVVTKRRIAAVRNRRSNNLQPVPALCTRISLQPFADQRRFIVIDATVLHGRVKKHRRISLG